MRLASPMGFAKVMGLAFLCSIGMAGFFSPPSHAETSPSDMIDAAEEIFLKGSVDGKSAYIIVGVQDAGKKIKDIWEWTTKVEDLRELKEAAYSETTGGAGMNGAYKEGVQVAKSRASKILSEPWKTIQGVPKAFRVNLEKANKAGGLKYVGWATWAVIEGGYYLVIEAPSEFIGYALGTVAAVPSYVVWQALLVSFDAVKIVVKYVIGALSSAAIALYSGLSAGSAAAAIMIAGGAVAVYHGGKWLFYDGPKSYFHPIQVVHKTGYTPDQMNGLALAFGQYFSELSEYEVESQISDSGSTITLRVSTPGVAKKSRFAVFSIYPKKGKLRIQAEIRKKFFKPKTKEVKLQLLTQLETWLKGVDEMMETPMPIFHPDLGSTGEALDKAS